METNSAKDKPNGLPKSVNENMDSELSNPPTCSSNQSEEMKKINVDLSSNKLETDPLPCSSKDSEECSSKENLMPESPISSKKAETEKLLDELTNNKNHEPAKEIPKNETKEEPTNNNTPNPPPNFGGYNFTGSNFPFSTPHPNKTYKDSEEYFADLRLWLQQAFFWQNLSASFPYFLMCQQIGQTPQSSSFVPPTSTSPGSTTNISQFTFPQFPMPGFQFPRQEQPPVARPEVIDGVECKIPSFWKRIAAEFIDFLLLFFVKIAVTYVAVDFFHFVEMDTFDLFQKDVKLAYKTFIQITQDIVILEMIHRLVVCAFETFWLIGGQNGRLGGSTPGKNIMGLRVITCDSSSALREGDDRVVVKPGGNLGLGTAFLRALTKNFVLALLIPTSFAFIFFPHNRTGYDMICNTIVVEEPIAPHRVHQD